ncbi:unnamed protein product, partial [Sphagnum balticum]
MGMCSSAEVCAQETQAAVIEKQIQLDKIQEQRTVKLILLGAGECGKSTILKQMQILHANGFTSAELLDKKYVVYSNTVKSQKCCKWARGGRGSGEDAKLIVYTVANGYDVERYTDMLYFGRPIKALWEDAGVQSVYARRNEFQLNDSAAYFFENIDRTSKADYVPNMQDVLQMRIQTLGVTETRFTISGTLFRVFDVGGQRSERRKWIHCFDNVNAIIFIIAINEFDQVLMEDSKTNRLQEAMSLYSTILTTPWFARASIILFLNKIDLFTQKLQAGKNIRSFFHNY